MGKSGRNSIKSNRAHVAARALSKLGRVIHFDDAYLMEDPKEFIRAKVYIEVKSHLFQVISMSTLKASLNGLTLDMKGFSYSIRNAV